MGSPASPAAHAIDLEQFEAKSQKYPLRWKWLQGRRAQVDDPGVVRDLCYVTPVLPQPESLPDLLSLEACGEGVFRAAPPRPWLPRVFGGHLLTQALWAASRTMSGAHCHALHANFVLAAEPEVPLEYQVQPLRLGKTLAVCNVTASQREVTRLVMNASFERELWDGQQHQQAMPDTPGPETFGDEATRRAKALERYPHEAQNIHRDWPFELIDVDDYDARAGGPPPAQPRAWVRARVPLSDDPNQHRAALAYASDIMVLDASLNAVRMPFDLNALQLASLDHAMWFHRFGRADQWLLLVCDSASVAGGRGLNRGTFFDREGRMLASVVQETLMRVRPTAPSALGAGKS